MIKEARRRRQISRDELSARSGWSLEAIARLERGDTTVGRILLVDVAQALELDDPGMLHAVAEPGVSLWVPGRLLRGHGEESAWFRAAYYHEQGRLEQHATRVSYCTQVLSTTLSQPSALIAAIMDKFRPSRARRNLVRQVVQRASHVVEAARRHRIQVRVLCLMGPTKDHFRSVSPAASRVALLQELESSVEIRVATRHLAERETRECSFALIEGPSGDFVTFSDQPLLGQDGRDCFVDRAPGRLHRSCSALFEDLWNDPHTFPLLAADLPGI